ncbi:MAG: hypothetical protein U1E50_12265 [Caulobacteraceae bacterium]
MKITEERIEEGGVKRTSFTLEVAGESVPGVIWAPEGAKGPRPLIIQGHGGSQHKKTDGIVARARQYARRHGWASMALDAPGHGDRITREQAAAQAADVGARVRGIAPPPGTPVVNEAERMNQFMARLGSAVPELNAALAAVQTLDFIGAGEKIGYWGVSMGTMIGVPFVAQCPQITCAVFGLAGLRAGAAAMEEQAKSITIPVEYVFQWEDAVAPREAGLALFHAFGSAEKTMHINPGGHMDIPNFEGPSWERFYLRHLGVAADARSVVRA